MPGGRTVPPARSALRGRLCHPPRPLSQPKLASQVSTRAGEARHQYAGVQRNTLASGHERIGMVDSQASIVLHRKVRWASATITLAVLVDDQEVAKLRI